LHNPSDFSILHFITSSGWIAQSVLAILVLFSIASWAIILQKVITLRKAELANHRFLAIFLKANTFQELRHHAKAQNNGGPIAALFSNVVEKATLDADLVKKGESFCWIEGLNTPRLERILHASIQDEMDYYQKYIHLLATIGNTSPFIGLFGTVVGIVNSFRSIGLQEVANIAVVAPGISEALVATAAGLAAAIPAVMAFNVFVNRLSRLEVKLEVFSSELITFIETTETKSLSSLEVSKK
jgi:biopolymer transport protein TolQ